MVMVDWMNNLTCFQAKRGTLLFIFSNYIGANMLVDGIYLFLVSSESHPCHVQDNVPRAVQL